LSTFYLLPPRPLVADRLAAYLRTLFPGLDLSWLKSIDLAEFMTSTAAGHPDVYVVYREDLAEGETAEMALRNGFGAEAGDEVVEVRPSQQPGELTARRWRLESLNS
jgi:hypothetical protein